MGRGRDTGGGAISVLIAAAAGGAATALVLLALGLVGGGGAAVASGAPAGKDVRRVYASAGPGVVAVRAEGRTGSGFLVDGHVVTNAHVVGAAGRVEVGVGGRRVPARVRGVEGSVDVAVLSLEGALEGLRPLEWGDSDGLRVGDPVVAIGAPFGLERSVTTGIVSGLGRRIDSPTGFAIAGVVQTDAALNPGNSGGPLLDMSGRVVGVATQIATEGGRNEGVGFAVPAATARRAAAAIAATGRAEVARPDAVGGDVGDGVPPAGILAGGPAEGRLQAAVALGRRTVRANADPGAARAASASRARVEGAPVGARVPGGPGLSPPR